MLIISWTNTPCVLLILIFHIILLILTKLFRFSYKIANKYHLIARSDSIFKWFQRAVTLPVTRLVVPYWNGYHSKNVRKRIWQVVCWHVLVVTHFDSHIVPTAKLLFRAACLQRVGQSPLVLGVCFTYQMDTVIKLLAYKTIKSSNKANSIGLIWKWREVSQVRLVSWRNVIQIIKYMNCEQKYF